MCGIFGFSYDNEKNTNYSPDFQEDISIFTNLSKIRGSDTFGLLISNINDNYIYKINTEPSAALKRNDYKSFIKNTIDFIKKNNDKKISVIGQTRLVTNGTKFLYANNQPIITKNIIGVHNGIIINSNSDETSKATNLESYSIKSDSLDFYENLNNVTSKDQSFSQNYLNYLNKVVGNYSIAFKPLNSSKIIISSNCGSLYYFYNKEKKVFLFSSEKQFLEKFLKKSKTFKLLQIKNTTNIEKVLNKSIIFDEKDNSLIILSHEKLNTETITNKFKIQNNFKVFDNFSESVSRLKNLKKCSKCILPETYPFIKFDNNGVCNYCNSYEKQKFLGEDELSNILEKYRSKDDQPDCLVGLSGGRDSSYGLHLLKTKYKMNPIAYTYDWGLTTDISRINQSRICGKLGIEHIIRSANI